MGALDGSNLDDARNNPAEEKERTQDVQQSIESPITPDRREEERKALQTDLEKKKTAVKLDVAASQLPKINTAPAAAPIQPSPAPEKKAPTLLEQAQSMFEDGKNYILGTEKKDETQGKEGEEKPEVKGVWGNTKKIFTDIKEDFDKSSPAVKAGYILGAGVGFMAARWLWRKAFGDGQKEGFVKKTAKWTVGLLAAAAAVVGIKSAKDFATRVTNSPLETIMGWFSGKGDGNNKPGAKGGNGENPPPKPEGAPTGVLGIGRDMITGAGKEFIDTGSKGLDLIKKDTKFWVDFFDKSPGEALEHLVVDGTVLALENGMFVIRDVAGKAITLPFIATAKAIEAFRTNKVPDDMWLVWGGAGSAYFMGTKAYQAFMLQGAKLIPTTKGAIITMGAKVVGWPYYMTQDALRAYLVARRPQGLQAMAINFKRNSLVGKILYGRETLGYINAIKNEKGALEAIDRWKKIQAEMRVIDQFDNEGFVRIFDAKQLKKVADIGDAVAIRIQDYAKTIQAGSLTDQTPAAIRTIAELSAEPNIGHFQEKLGKFVQQEYAETLSSKGTKAAAAATEATSDASKVAKAGEAVAGEKAAAEVVEESAKTVAKLEQTIRTDSKLAAMLNKLKVTPRQFLGVLRNAKAMKLAGKAVPYVGAGLQWWIYTFIDEPEWQAKLEKETDPLKKKVIENEMFSARMNWKLDAIGAPAALSLPGLTLLLGNFARQWTNEGIVEGTKYMLQDRKDLMDKSPGAILSEIQKSAPGSMVNGRQSFASGRLAGILEGNLQNMGSTFEKGNTSARSEAYAAYFEKNVVLPPISVDLLSAEELKDPVNVERRLRILNQDQTKYFTQAALSYIASVTKNTFTMLSPDELHHAEIYAKKSWQDWINSRMGQPSTFTQLGAAEKQKLVVEAAKKEKTDRIADLKKQIESGVAVREAISFSILESIGNDLSLAESKILAKDYSNWSVANWTNENEMQQIARGQYQAKIGEKLRQISQSSMPLTEQSFDAARQSLLGILALDPDALAVEGLKSEGRARLAEKGKDPACMTIAGMLYGMNDAVPTVKPAQNQTPHSAQSKTNAPTQAA